MPKSVIEYLKNKGYNIFWIRKSSYAGSDDETIARLSLTMNAPIITLDKDFGRMYYFKYKSKITIFLIRVKPATPDNIMMTLENFLSKYDFEDFKGSLVIISKSKIRKIYLPLD